MQSEPPPFSLPTIDRSLYALSDSTAQRPRPQRNPDGRPAVPDIPPERWRPPNPASSMVKKLKARIRGMKEVLPSEAPFDPSENYMDYSQRHGGFQHVCFFPERLRRVPRRMVKVEPSPPVLLDPTVKSQETLDAEAKAAAPRVEVPVHAPQRALEPLYEGPIEDWNALRATCLAESSKRDTADLATMDELDTLRMWKWMRFRSKGLSFDEARAEMVRESEGARILMSYPNEPRKDCERCFQTPATGTKLDPFRYLTAQTAQLSGAHPDYTAGEEAERKKLKKVSMSEGVKPEEAVAEQKQLA